MLVDEAHEIEANLDKYLDLDNDDFKTFRDALARAEEVLAMTTPEQAVIDEAAIALSNAMSAMRLIPDKEELANLVGEAEAINRSQFTSGSLSKLDRAVGKAKQVLNAEDATQEQVNEAYTALSNALDTLEKKTETQKTSGSSSSYNWNLYGPAGIVAANGNALAPYVVSDTTVDFTVRRGCLLYTSLRRCSRTCVRSQARKSFSNCFPSWNSSISPSTPRPVRR